MSPIDFPQIYNPGNQTRDELIENFVVRTEIFQEIFDDLATSEMKYPEQHVIIQGVRGQGKTTLLLRIAYEILNNKKLHERLIPVIFNEEQYNISRLFKLWETVAEYLDEKNEISGLYDEMQKFDDDDDYERRCFELLEQALVKKKGKLILFIDNIDDMLKKFTDREHKRLREIFTESAEIRIIGASSVSLEFHFDYGHPFYQFFKMPRLRGLSTEETKTLLLKLGEHYKRKRVKEIVEHQIGRVEALRRLTGGVIRTIILLYEIFVDDNQGDAFMDLEKILDSVTPLYKQRMESLSPQQQEIVDFIALSWDAVSTKEISQKTKLASKAVSAQIKQLEKYHIIDKIETDTKNLMYRISERFFNIWYLMSHGRKWDEKRVRFLVEFLQVWCNRRETEFQDIKKAEKYYLMAVEKEHAGAMNNLAWIYFEMKKNKEKALQFAEAAYANQKDIYKAHTLSTILLWNNEIQRAIEISNNFLETEEALEEFPDDVVLFLMLLMAKKQYHLALNIFRENPHHLKDRFKPVYYALMHFLTDEFPNEHKKMGGELEETVKEIIEKLKQMENDYD